MARLEQLRTAQGISLPPRLKSEIKRELQRLELVVKMIATLEAERDAIVEDEASTHVNAKKIQNLHKLKAIGPEFATVLVGEIFHRKFNNRRQLVSYVGYAPSWFQSGNVAHDQGISNAGNRKGRTTGIELAWLWLRYQPDSDLSVWFRARVGTTKGRIRRIAIVAMARKLLVAMRGCRSARCNQTHRRWPVSCSTDLARCSFGFERREEALHRGIVPDVV